ncbi:MAG: hypothetical protein NDI69_14595 [Bacteriovoracaceae bacterium]|nr:hypothetical protein [Bacteriovoracaceae bacterium]
MRMFLFLMFLAFSNVAFTQDITSFEKGDLHFSKAHSELISVNQICPPRPDRISCRAFGSIAKVRVTLNACLDRFGGHFSRFEVIDGKGVLFFGAINIFNQSSTTARCVRAPTEIITINVPFEGEIELAPLNFRGMTLTTDN